MKVPSKIEAIFAQAAALHQAGRLRSTIYAHEDVIHILNGDKTVILFFMNPDPPTFLEPYCFEADDYDSNEMEIADGRVVFVQRGEQFERRKYARIPPITSAEVSELFQRHLTEFEAGDESEITIHKEMLPLLDPSLSHLEIISDRGNPVFIQRDIYTGSLIRLDRRGDDGLFDTTEGGNPLPDTFGPVGIRTADFMSLFSFSDTIKIIFSTAVKGYCLVEGEFMGMLGVISFCLYDDLGTITLSRKETNGREKSEKSGGERKAHQEAGAGSEPGKQENGANLRNQEGEGPGRRVRT